jgi:hypothetical protein
MEDRVIGVDQFHQPCRHFGLVDGVGHVEINAAVGFADRCAGDRVGADHREQMAGGVHAHQFVAPVPVDMLDQFFAHFRHRLIRVPGSG